MCEWIHPHNLDSLARHSGEDLTIAADVAIYGIFLTIGYIFLHQIAFQVMQMHEVFHVVENMYPRDEPPLRGFAIAGIWAESTL